MQFLNRADAGRHLADRLPPIDVKETVVIALPRGGVPVGAVIADKLGVPLDVILVRKVGAPMQPELAVAAVTDGQGMQVTVNEDIKRELGLSDEDVETLARQQLPEIERRRELYYGGREPSSLAEKTVIVVDDGVATGATAGSALRLIRGQKPRRLILALPVAPADSVSRLERYADEVICLSTPSPFFSVGTHYADFDQVDDNEVIELLARNREASRSAGDDGGEAGGPRED